MEFAPVNDKLKAIIKSNIDSLDEIPDVFSREATAVLSVILFSDGHVHIVTPQKELAIKMLNIALKDFNEWNEGINI